jgi:NitT/TauT family transport system permease protein
MFGSPAIKRPRRIQLADAVVLALVGLVIYALVATAQRWNEVYLPETEIDLSFSALPIYAIYSLSRALIAYALSLAFTLTIGYWAAKSARVERFVAPLLDIGQSMPVLGFLPGLVLGLVALFPSTNVGLELACILLIFTSQVWNMAFSLIASIKGIPNDLQEMARNVGLSKTQRLLRLELPCAATGLAWNSLMSIAGGWFFLTVCEAFRLGNKDFKLPGLGSYMAVAIERGDTWATWACVATMMTVIVFMDFVIWRPIIAWTGKFQLSDGVQSTESQAIPFMSLLIKDSPVFRALADQITAIVHELDSLRRRSGRLKEIQVVRIRESYRRAQLSKKNKKRIQATLEGIGYVGLGIGAFWIFGNLYRLLEPVRWVEWRDLLVSTSFTAARVFAAILIASLWVVPAGIAIGSSAKWTKRLQPVVQIVATFPSPMLFPLVIAVLLWLGVPMGVASAVLMMVGVQWYILFNVLSGAMGISNELRETFRLAGVSRATTWRVLYIPSVFPSLVTGWMTAAGGAWNASILAEYVVTSKGTLDSRGLGATITRATAEGNYPVLAASLIVMIVVVVTLNRALWARLCDFAENRFRFER